MGKETDLRTSKRQSVSLIQLGLTAFYGVILFLIYYRTKDTIVVGGIQLRIRFLLSVVLSGTAVVHFFVVTDVKRGAALLGDVFMLMLPNLILILGSFPVWVLETIDPSVMRRGLIDQLYGIAMITMAGGLYYVFGKRAFQINLIAVLAAYLLKLAAVVAQFGVGPFMSELVTMLTTFADQTGDIMRAVEFHEPTFCLGILLLGIALRLNKHEKLLWIEFAIGLLCFITGFKRIAVLACAIAVASYAVLMLLTGKGKRMMWLVNLVGFGAIVVCFGYLLATKMGLFSYLESIGINTLGRSYLSEKVDPYYAMTPDFIGQGTGFVSRLMSMHGNNIKALHNGPLQIYIDNGFWGFWLWGLAFMPMRISHFTKACGGKVGLIAFCCTLTLLITSLTDNTIFYADVAGALSMVIMYYRMEDRPV